jgi:hypothetical protein
MFKPVPRAFIFVAIRRVDRRVRRMDSHRGAAAPQKPHARNLTHGAKPHFPGINLLE